MCSSCAMVAFNVTPLTEEEEGVEVDGAEGARGVRRLKIRSRKMANDPCDSRRKDKLITGHCILIDIYKRGIK